MCLLLRQFNQLGPCSFHSERCSGDALVERRALGRVFEGSEVQTLNYQMFDEHFVLFWLCAISFDLLLKNLENFEKSQRFLIHTV